MEEILNALKLDKRLINLSLGVTNLNEEYYGTKSYGLTTAGNDVGNVHPPFFIPILIDYNGTPIADGIVKHWFVDRKMSFGNMDFATTFLTGEFALTSNQFLDTIVYDQILIRDTIVSNEFLEEVKGNGINFNEINLLVQENMDYSESKSYFKDKPLFLYDQNENINNYKGDYSTAGNIIISKNIAKACFCEISHLEWIGYPSKKQGFSLFKKKPKFEPLENIPEWLRPDTNKKELFEKYINSQDYGKAWLTINGPGFTPIEVGERLQRLKEFSSEKGYHLWADFWCEKYGNQDSFVFM